jgi:hypothetical protein
MIDDEDESQWHVPPFVWLTVGGGLAVWLVAAVIVWKLVSR